MWLVLLIFYIPYVLLLLPTQLDPEDLLESGAVIPHEDYSTFMIVAAIVILLGLFVDRDGLQSFLISIDIVNKTCLSEQKSSSLKISLNIHSSKDVHFTTGSLSTEWIFSSFC